MNDLPNASRARRERTFFGHPWPLATLFGMEVWERFSFYGMQAILLIYLYYETTRGGLAISQPVAIGIVGAYGSGVYLAAILGGWFADRVFGAERTLFYSGIIVMLGHAALALIPSVHGVAVGLVCIALGGGGVKATCSSLVGSLYAPGSPRRDAGFSLFYLGINVGGFAGPLLTGVLQQSAGFHYGFGIAALGMAVGLLQYAKGRKRLPEAQKTAPTPLDEGSAKRYAVAGAAAVAGLALAIVAGWVRADNLAAVLLGIIACASVAYFYVILRSDRVTNEEKRRVYAFIPLFLTSAVFWALYSQFYTVITAFFDQRVNRDFWGWTVPVGWLVSVQALTIIVFSGVFAWLWTTLGKRQPSSAGKFVLAMGIIGLTFLGYVPFLGSLADSMPLSVLVVLLLGFTCAELCLSPIGLSVSTKLAPRAFQTQMLALFFMSMSLGFASGGELGGLYTPETEVTYFVTMAVIALGSGALLLVCLPFIRKTMQGVD